MKTLNLKSMIAMLSAVSLAAIAPLFLGVSPAAAQPVGMSGSYVGAGISAGVTSHNGEDGQFGGNVQGRFDLPLAPVSVRGALLFGGDAVSIVPSVTADLPIAPNTNLYAGVGYSFVTDEGSLTQLGNRNSVVLSAGAETAVARNIVIYGDVKLGIDAFRNSSDSAVALQLGAAYRF
ncbi:MAG TPA: outer membrane beta-barrel protein [Synechococcales cyanobacterium M55_K2018_004]|nr:outer membrane beta-barrel protein [Synechococcales cyanobacterium M55_K2018_004]